MNMVNSVAGVKIPDSKIAKEAADLLREYGSELLWNHSNRAYLFGEIQGREAGLKYDSELLYVSALFHDLGLTSQYSSPDKRFEVDGANAARSFLQQHSMEDESVRLVWDAIALHTTIGVAEYKESEVSLLYSGVGLDVMGDGYHQFPEKLREEVVSAYPRNNFKEKILPAFYEGFKHKPETTFGNIKADVCERFMPDYKSPDFCECVLHSPWKE